MRDTPTSAGTRPDSLPWRLGNPGAAGHPAPAWLDRVHPHDRPTLDTWLAPLRRAGGSPGTSRIVCRLRPEGSPLPADAADAADLEGHRWVEIEAVRTIDEAGHSIVSGLIVPVDGSRRPLDCLASRIHRLETMLHTVSECFKVVDDEARLVEMNDAGLSMIGAEGIEQVRGVEVLKLLLPEYHEEFRRGLAAALRGERVTLQFEIRGLDGTHRWMEQVAVMLPPTSPGEPPSQIGAFTRDITQSTMMIRDLSAAREQAEAASRAKSEFLANMSHEIRTPMTAILGFTDLLDEPDLTPAERASHVATVRRNGEHLLTIINDILDLSKIESGRMTLESIPTSPRAILEEVIELMRVRTEATGLSLELRCEDPLPGTINSDPVRLRQIVMNLLGNAIKFTERGGVTVTAGMADSADGTVLRVAVQDTGIGMATDQQARLFDAFAQADASMTRRFGGTGLGLRISRRLAELLGGGIEVTSAPGVGSTFVATVAAGPQGGIAPGPPAAGEQPSRTADADRPAARLAD